MAATVCLGKRVRACASGLRHQDARRAEQTDGRGQEPCSTSHTEQTRAVKNNLHKSVAGTLIPIWNRRRRHVCVLVPTSLHGTPRDLTHLPYLTVIRATNALSRTIKNSSITLDLLFKCVISSSFLHYSLASSRPVRRCPQRQIRSETATSLRGNHVASLQNVEMRSFDAASIDAKYTAVAVAWKSRDCRTRGQPVSETAIGLIRC